MQKNPARKMMSSLVFLTTLFVSLVPSSLTGEPKPVLASLSVRPGAASSQLAAGPNFGLAVDADGNVWSWGDNSQGQLGQGNADENPVATPVKVKDLTDVISVSAGGAHALALKADGTVWAWGNNDYDQSGAEEASPITLPRKVESLQNIVGIAAGLESNLALAANGQVWAWGGNEYKQVNNTDTIKITAPQIIDNLSGVVKIAVGSAWSLALKNDGTVWTWGAQKVILGTDGEEGMLNFTNLTQVNGISDIVSVSAGFSHSLALKEDGTVWGWGSNELLQLGNTEQQWFETPVQIPALKDVTSVSAGAYLSMALKKDGTIWTLGANGSGQLGNGYKVSDLPISAAPVKVVHVTKANSIAAGYGFALGRADGYVWGWGGNTTGQLGNGSVDAITGGEYVGTYIPTMGKRYLRSAYGPDFSRLAGYTAVNTAVEISKQGWPTSSSTVILATASNFPDALSAATLAHQFDAPILLTNSKTLDPAVQGEIERLKPTKIIIVGGSAVVSGQIEEALKQNYSDVTRLAGWDQYETAAKIADYYYSINPDAPKKVVIANGDNFPDALSISSWAAYNRIPILLTRSKQLPEATYKALQQNAIKDAIIVGGFAVINKEVAYDIIAHVSRNWGPDDQGKSIVRYWGMDQYETSIAIAKGLRADINTVMIATGENFPDALAGSALAARTGSPIILVDKHLTKASVLNFLADNSGQIRETYLLGGSAVISDTSFNYLSNYLARS
ncbi:cell wall-binding repeat-containing protein [Desulfosporosinus sp. BICA1-9]|uniref:RCC1 domain-containing protein n=1 Tax=Desulfosporosinus sp. BICA1-9 TaxID=1531958 RepID=UPI00054B1420|nr:cell wall-binding repeat-containing protein [Desulfosporosinus sp. BICA1-9]KJS48216.1 MAG: cell wall-binding protein [Peptococcaceae bacterium BRH_c23]KJS83275.1 MAG: cell wall-binding protein [Desulfosporosinus sp. BICA1-9]HBW38185.1 cell wall-binding protein [Desulfosporosinus sp.]